ncbi:GGDEF domain-containing protein [Qipengyuania sp. 1XM1-15A]|uniref:sensor domain-containing diguanylate cyclase n=1 Tax=Qipengyuania xiamenensis TaxID=2867237 RepID=UPI001C878198|nr:diguanylate cyclase [Qipengyuania xiamenensis]MBX7532719.1 GGDEF domain-containing protein [Qipengyuania xiamenensis]
MGVNLAMAAPRFLRLILIAFLAILGAIAPAAYAQEAAQAAKFAPGSICHTSDKAGTTYDSLLSDGSRWTCEGAEFDWDAERHFIRHDLTKLAEGAQPPRYAEFDRNEYEKLTVIAVEADGTQSSVSYSFADTQLGSSSLKSIVAFPQSATPPVAIVMVLDKSWWPETLVAAKLVAEPSVEAKAGYIHLLAALLCGLFLAPIIFDLGYFRALRQSFPLFHAAFCLMAAIQTAAVSGLIPLIMPISYSAELIVTYFTLDLMILATVLFAYKFVEQEFMTRRHKVIMLCVAAGVLTNGAVLTFFPEPFGLWIDRIYFGALCTLLAGYFYVLFSARAAGSRMAPYLILGFAPLTAIVIFQAVSVFFVDPINITEVTFDETWAQNLALLFEVVATALAVADRFISIRRERDRALDAARAMEALTEHDDLTGLLNRRALQSRFPALVQDGFTVMAIIDIDRFKAINDMHGHPVGDAVLRYTGDTLRGGADRNLVAFRIGGEEFLLMLRGKDAAKRAEARRRAISSRTLAEIEGLDSPVTASMGLLDFETLAQQQEVDFGALYSRADQLLYEAKCAGRNRTCSDTVEMFEAETTAGRSAA